MKEIESEDPTLYRKWEDEEGNYVQVSYALVPHAREMGRYVTTVKYEDFGPIHIAGPCGLEEAESNAISFLEDVGELGGEQNE